MEEESGSMNWDLEDGSGWIHGREEVRYFRLEKWRCKGWEGRLSWSHIAKRRQWWLEKG